MRQLRSWREAQVQHFRDHPEDCAAYLEIVLEEVEQDGDWSMFALALRTIAEARNIVLNLPEPPTNATLGLAHFQGALRALGLRLAILPAVAEAAPASELVAG